MYIFKDRDIPREQSEKFEKFKDLLTEYNEKHNLTSICDEKGIYIKHFYDSIYPEKYFPFGAQVIEIGSGGGFHSVPLKIVRNDLKFTLVESRGKKCGFLEVVKENLALENVNIINARAEELSAGAHREKYDVSVARAVAKLNTLCEYCLPFVKVGGRFIAYKGNAEEEIKESLNAIKVLGGEIECTEKYSLPENEGERTVIIIKKIRKTSSEYPRGRGLERKKPL